jgi:chemotaxis protein methyltransferase CheR
MLEPLHSRFEREFPFTVQDFNRVRTLIYRHAGIRLKESKEHMVYSRLARRLRATGKPTCRDYLDFAEHDQVEWQNFVNALTTNLTAFFREPHHFSILADHLKTLASTEPRRVLTIWSAAVSSGEEAYSAAMTAAEVFGTLTPPVKILATDVDTQVLKIAEKGVFTRERVEKLSGANLKRFFLKGQGPHEGFVKIRSELRELITFRQSNLLATDWQLKGPFDAIFCRNVMIYFDKPTQYQILERFVPLLRPHGLLFAGHSENFHHASRFFSACGKTVYRVADFNESKEAIDG